MDLQNARVNTAGAYVCLDGLYPFAVGARPYNGRIPIVRLGGHREERETGWQCAEREVYEETTLRIKPLTPPVTYLANGDQLEAELQEIHWRFETQQEPIPLLVVAYRREDRTLLSLMYLAQADGLPAPSAEIKGLLLLKEKDIHRLCRGALTLEQYLSSGGKALLNHEFDRSLILEPFAQLRLLAKVLKIQFDHYA